MPIENPRPGKYLGCYCIRCGAPIALTEWRNGADAATVRGDWVLDCMNPDCRFQADYRSSDMRALEIGT